MGFLDWLIRALLPPVFRDAIQTARAAERARKAQRRRAASRAICVLPKNGELPARKGTAPAAGHPGDGIEALAKGLGLNPRRLARLLYSKNRLYTAFTRAKQDGGRRTIHAPVPPLKFVQRRILDRILNWVELPDCVHGFRRGRSLVTGAREHVGKEMVLRMDIEDFFPSIHFGRVLGAFRSLEFSKKHSFLLAKLTTVDGVLPQGAPTSPGIVNLICRKLDRRLAGAARKRGVAYTRYADDMAFSGAADEVKRMVPFVKKVLAEEGFKVSAKKLRLMRRGRRQVVTGVVVNAKPSAPRYYRRWLRAVLHRLRTKGVTADGRSKEDSRVSLRSHAHFIRMVNPEQGEKLVSQLRAVFEP